MKKMLGLVMTVVCSLSAFSTPRKLHLVSPSKIEVVGSKVKLTVPLACKNQFPDEWAGNLIAVSDDNGDLETSLAIVLSKNSCEKGPVQDYVFEYDLKQTGVSAEQLDNGVTLVPADVSKKN